MKKVLLAIGMSFCATLAIAQMDFVNVPLEEALKMAEKSNKKVLAIISTTWCGPCKQMESDLYPLPEVGDYVNDKFVSLKYTVDKSDPEKIIKRYGCEGYPTYLIINSDGTEYSRFIGNSFSAKVFIGKLARAVMPGNSNEERERRLKEDPSYVLEHVKFLNELTRNQAEKGKKLFEETYKSRSITGNFADYNLPFYRSMIKNTDSEIFKDFVNNKDEITKIIGKKSYNEYLKIYFAGIITNSVKTGGTAGLNRDMEVLNNNPQFGSHYTKWIIDNKELILDDDIAALLKSAVKLRKKLNKYEQYYLVDLLTRNNAGASEIELTPVIAFVQEVIDVQTDLELIDYLEYIKSTYKIYNDFWNDNWESKRKI